MRPVAEEVDFVRELAVRRAGGGQAVFESAGKGLAILDAAIAQKVNAANHADSTLPDRLGDLLRGRKSEPFAWKQVRAAWSEQLKQLSAAPQVAALRERMAGLLDRRLGTSRDLVWAFQEIVTRSLVPAVLADISPAEERLLLREQTFKLTRLMNTVPRKETFWDHTRSAWIQLRAGLVSRRVLRGRARGKRPRRLDLADPIVDLLPGLGMGRAVDALTGMLTAITGPPGGVATCLVYELSRREELAARLEAELAAIPHDEFHAAPLPRAPLTHRFVKEVLRVWSAPSVLTRVARTPHEVCGHALAVGQHYHLSPYFAHHDPADWQQPEVFDPDRWLPESEGRPRRSCAYAPFGWSPTSCIGAGLGTIQLMLLCHLLSTEYRIQVEAPESVRLIRGAIPMPVGFRGVIERR